MARDGRVAFPRLLTDDEQQISHVLYIIKMDLVHWPYSGKIVITTYGFLALTSSAEEILWEKVVAFSHRSGLFWDVISIEIHGQTAASIMHLSRDNSKRLVMFYRSWQSSPY